MLRTVLLASLLSFAALVPAASAAVDEACVASVRTTGARVECDGFFYEAATLTWCPRHPLITCINHPLLTCFVDTATRPAFGCPPLA